LGTSGRDRLVVANFLSWVALTLHIIAPWWCSALDGIQLILFVHMEQKDPVPKLNIYDDEEDGASTINALLERLKVNSL
jgi:hypothetical protein